MDLICVMHDCEPYGHLTTNGRPMTPEQIVNQIGGNVATVRKMLSELIENGVARTTDAGIIFNKRMVRDEQIRNARANGGKAGAEHGAKGAESGSKGGRPKVQKGGFETPLSTPLPGFEYPPPSSSSSSSSSDTPQPPMGADRRFGEFWTAYPRKVGKDAARKAFDKRRPDDELLGKMVEAIRHQASSQAWLKDGGQYIPHPSTWLNEGRWQDDDSFADGASDWTRAAA